MARGLGPATGFLLPVVTLATGTVAAQALVFGARPVLTRLFTPEEFGVLTLFLALAAIINSFSSGRYEDALMLPERDEDAANVLALGALLVTATATLLALILVWREPVAALLGESMLAPSLWLLPPAVLLFGWSVLADNWHTRRNRFGVVSWTHFAHSAAVVAVQVSAGLMTLGAIGLTGGSAAGFGVAMLVGAGWLLVRDGRFVAANLRWRGIRDGAVRYARFPRFSAPAAFFGLMSTRIPVILLAFFFGGATVGQFGIALGTLTLPVGLLATAIGRVFFVRAAEAHREGRLAPLVRDVHRRLVIVAVFPSLAVLVAGPELFAFVFGEVWREAGIYARFLSLWTLFASVASPLTRIFDVTERQRADLAFGAMLFVVQAAVLVAGGLTGDPLLAVAATGGAGALLRVLQVGWMLRMAGAALPACGADLLRQFALVLPFLGAVALAQALGAPGWALLAVTAAAGAAYLALAFRLERAGGRP
jgi:lipopolysaccharide exporter